LRGITDTNTLVDMVGVKDTGDIATAKGMAVLIVPIVINLEKKMIQKEIALRQIRTLIAYVG